MTERLSTLMLLPLVALACAEAPADDPATSDAEPAGEVMPAPERSVAIVSPAEGDTVPAGSLEVTLSAAGVEIVPAGDTTPGSGHHHIFLDADISPLGEPIPSVPGSIVHMGDASMSYTFENVAPGEHRLIAVVGDWQHVPLEPLVTDTVVFVAR